MISTIAAILTVATLAGWHLRTRRHPCWSTSPNARFCITAGYPAVAISVFWLVQATTTTTATLGWEWVIGNVWALGAMVSFVYGFNALHFAREQQQQASQAIESIAPMTSEAGTSRHPSTTRGADD